MIVDVNKESYTPNALYYTCRFLEIRDGVKIEYVRFKNKEQIAVKDMEGRSSWRGK